MPDRFSRSRGGGITIAAPEAPNLQPQIDKQLSFLKMLDAMQQRAAAAARGRKVLVGIDPNTGEPIYMDNPGGGKVPEAVRKQAYDYALKKKGRDAIAGDADLNRIKAELYSGQEMSAQKQERLLAEARNRTNALAKQYGVSVEDAYTETFGTAAQKAAQDKSAFESGGMPSAFYAGLRQGFNSLTSGIKEIAQTVTGDRAGALETARQNAEENREIAMSNPVMRETTLRQQEAAAEGRDAGYFDNAEGNTLGAIAGTAGNLAGGIAPMVIGAPVAAAIGAPAGVVGAIGGAVGGAVTGGILGQSGYNERVATAADLTDQQKEEALTNGGAFLNLALNAGAGALIPGRAVSGVKQWAGTRLGNRILGTTERTAPGISRTIAGPPTPSMADIVGRYNASRIVQAGERAAANAARPRTLGTLTRDVLGNSVENAAIMGAATAGSNFAYNVGTDRPAFENVGQGVQEGMVEGALLGVPFGYMNYRGRQPLRQYNAEHGYTGSSPSRATPPPTGSNGASGGLQGVLGGGKKKGAEPVIFRGSGKHEYAPAIDRKITFSDDAVQRLQQLKDDTGFDIEAVNFINGSESNAEIAKVREPFVAWTREVIDAARKHDDATLDQLLYDYINAGGRVQDLDYILASLDNSTGKKFATGKDGGVNFDNIKFPSDIYTTRWDAMAKRSFGGAIVELENLMKGGRDEYLKARQGTGRHNLSGFMDELNKRRKGASADTSTGTGGALVPYTPVPSEQTPSGATPPNNLGNSTAKSGGPGGATPPNGRTGEETPIPPAGQEGAGQNPNAGPDTNGTRAGGEQTGTGAGESGGEGKRGPGDGSNGAAGGGGEQPNGGNVKRSQRESQAHLKDSIVNAKDGQQLGDQLLADGYYVSLEPQYRGERSSLRVYIKDSDNNLVAYKERLIGQNEQTIPSVENIILDKNNYWKLPDSKIISTSNKSDSSNLFRRKNLPEIDKLNSAALGLFKNLDERLNPKNPASSNEGNGQPQLNDFQILAIDSIAPEGTPARKALEHLSDMLYRRANGVSITNKAIQAALENFVQRTFLGKFPWMKRVLKDIVVYNEDSRTRGTWSSSERQLRINVGAKLPKEEQSPEVVASNLITVLQHELLSHGMNGEAAGVLSHTVREALFNKFSNFAGNNDYFQAIRERYSRQGKPVNERQVRIGDEISAFSLQFLDNTFSRIDDATLLANGITSLISDRVNARQITGLISAIAQERITPEQMRNALMDAVINTPEVRDMYLKATRQELLTNSQAFADASPLAQATALDYIQLTEKAGVTRSEGSLREYLEEILDPDTEVNVYKADSKIC